MTSTAGDYLCELLADWGVSTVYGFPGDGINGILGALRRQEDQLRFTQVRHEEMAAFMACGHARFTGEVGGLARRYGGCQGSSSRNSSPVNELPALAEEE